jgi:hypothetical protein
MLQFHDASKIILSIDYLFHLQTMSKPINRIGDLNPGRDKALLLFIAIFPIMRDLARENYLKLVKRLEAKESIPGISIWGEPNSLETSFYISAKDQELAKIILIYPLVRKLSLGTKWEFLERLEDSEKIDGVEILSEKIIKIDFPELMNLNLSPIDLNGKDLWNEENSNIISEKKIKFSEQLIIKLFGPLAHYGEIIWEWKSRPDSKNVFPKHRFSCMDPY